MDFKKLVQSFSSPVLKPKMPEKSGVFCMAPWTQLHAQIDGKVYPCCMSLMKDGYEIGNLKENPDLLDSWNSEGMKQLRLNMLQGKETAICTQCYDYEKLGKESERMTYNRDYADYAPRVNATLEDGTVEELSIPVLDVRFSNKCNYKCRICSGNASSSLYEEEMQLSNGAFTGEKEMKVAKDQTKFMDSYFGLLPGVKRVHFAGGEPLFMDEHYQILEHLIAIGNTDLNLTYNTNFSTLRYKKYRVTEMWNNFRQVDIWASLDGMGDRGDYQRKGQNWKNIEENILTVQRDCPTAVFGISVTVSIFNILHIPAYYQYLVENKLVQPDRMNLYFLFEPGCFRITNLSPALKEKAIRQFSDLESNFLSTLPDASHIRSHIKAVIGFMMSEDLLKRKEFQNRISAVDAIRGENFSSVFPELADMMNDTDLNN